MAETGAVGIIETGAMGVAGATAESIPTSAATPSPSKFLQSTEIGIQIKGDCYKGETQVHTCKEEMTKKKGKNKLGKNKRRKGERHIPMNSASGGTLPSSLELEILFFKTGSSSRSSRTSLDPLEDKSTSGPRVAELGIEEGITTNEESSFTA